MKTKEALEKVSDSVEIEDFQCHPTIFVKWFALACGLAVIAVSFFYLSLTPINPILFSTLAFLVAFYIFLMMLYEFILYKEFVDVFFKKKPSLNIVGKIGLKQGEPPKRIIIFSGHHDSALQFRWLRYLKHGYFVAEGIMIVGVLCLIVLLGLRFILTLSSIEIAWITNLTLWVIWIIMPPAVIVGIFFADEGKNGGKVPGAIDNLSAVSCVIAMGRIIKKHPEIIPANTEIRLVSFGSEEAGCRGSIRYVERHLAELRATDAVCVNFESIASPTITIFKGDRNSTVKNDPRSVAAMEAAAIAAKIPHEVHNFPFGGGGTDVIPFSIAKIKAVCLSSLKIPQQFVEFYHQEFDNIDKVNKIALGNAIKIAVEYLKRFS